MQTSNLQGFYDSVKKIGERLVNEKKEFREERWIPNLEEKINKLNFNRGDLIYIQFNQKLNESGLYNCGHLLNQDALFGKIVHAGKNVDYLIDRTKDKKIIKCNTEEYSEAMEIWIRDPDIEHRIKTMYDPEYSRHYSCSNYSTNEGIRLLIAGISLNPLDTGINIVGSLSQFPKLLYEQFDNQLLIHTNYLKAVNADVFLNKEIKEGIKKYQRNIYKPIISKFKENIDIQIFKN